MATPRLTFLWPFLFKPARPNINQAANRNSRRALRSSTRKRQEISTQRYGTANEPLPALGQPQPQQQQQPKIGSPKAVKTESKANAKPSSRAKKDKVADGDKAAAADKQTLPGDETQSPPQIAAPDPAAAAAPAILNLDSSSSTASSKPQPSQPSQPSTQQSPQPSTKEPSRESASSAPSSLSGPDNPPVTAPPPKPLIPAMDPLQTVLNMPSSSDMGTAQIPHQSYYHENASASPDEHRPPHISTPQFVHHFDTYSLVKRLIEGGWREDQAVTVMKAVRLVLADNMDLAREGLVSRSNVENETYLFRAACSELRTEVGMRRKAETEKTRTERTGLQNEVDILGQRVGMEAGGLKEELKGMVEGRKMAVREEGRSVDSKIQELNYHITVALNSDSRSDVEGVRWIITKRAITAIAICVMMVISSLKFASTSMQREEEDRKKRAAAAAANPPPQNGGQQGNGPDQRARSGDDGVGDIVVRQGDNPSFVSLG